MNVRVGINEMIRSSIHTRRLTQDEVPPLPADAEFLPFQSKGATLCFDYEGCRWRVAPTPARPIITFIRYRTKEERANGEHPWLEAFSAELPG